MEERLIELIELALNNHATDIHFTIKNNKVIIELRINKQLYSVKPKINDDKFYRYLMYRANLDLALRSLPQTGHFNIIIKNKRIALRFACLNSHDLSCGVLRLLNNHEKLEIEDLCNDQYIINCFKKICNLSTGLVVFSGPTSSGKTTTLYSILQHIQNKKIYTLEEDLEIKGEFDSIFLNQVEPIKIVDKAYNREIVMEKHGSKTTVVWNPAKDLAEMSPEQYKTFVCVEPSNVGDYCVKLAPQAKHIISATINLQKLK